MWNKNNILDLYELPFSDLIHKAHSTHRENFEVNQVQVSTLLSIKTAYVLKIVNIVLNQHIITQKLKRHPY